MSKHNVLFYSNHPQDQLSREIIQELNRNSLLKEQYVTICVNQPGIKLPRVVMEHGEIPCLVTRGFKKLISGNDALSLVKEANSGKATGLDYGDVDKAAQVSEDHGILANESGRTSYHQAFNEDWNHGAENDERTVNSAYSTIEEGYSQGNVDTYEEQGKHNTRGLKNQLNKKLQDIQQQRASEVPGPIQRIDSGGFPGGERGRFSDGANHGIGRDGGMGGGMDPRMMDPRMSRGNGGQNFQPNFEDSGQAFGGAGGMDGFAGGHGFQRTPQIQNPYAPGGGMVGAGPAMGNHGFGEMSPESSNPYSRRIPSENQRFLPQPVNNPLFSHQGNLNNPGAQAPRGGGRALGFPELPSGFGQIGGGNSGGGSGGGGGLMAGGGSNIGGGAGYSSLDSAFSGEGLMGNQIQGSQFGRQPNHRGGKMREVQLSHGLPSGRGHAGPNGNMINTSNY